MSKRYAFIAFLIVVIALFFGLHYGVLGANQGGTAHGAQGANLALSQGFVDNDLNFFEPQTKAQNFQNGDFSLNKIDANGRTAAHFPIHNYLPAVIHTITDWKLSKVVQGYNIVWGFIGLFFLYLLSLRVTNSIGKSLFVIVFIGTAPIFAFYQSNSLPELPSFASVIAGIYFMYRWKCEKVQKFAWCGMTWLLFASLPSPDNSIYLGIAIYAIYSGMPKKENFYGQPLVLALLFFIVLLVSEAWFNVQRSDHGSQFAGWLQDWNYHQSVGNSIFGTWKLHYFTTFQTVVGVLVLILLITQVVRKKARINWKNSLLLDYGYIALGGFFFALINPYQAVYSDVFFLKTLLVAVVCILIHIVSTIDIDWIYRYPKMATGVFLMVLLVMISEGNWTQNVRKELNRISDGSNLAFAFLGGDELLKKHNVKVNDTLNVVIPNDSGIGFEVLEHLDHRGIIREVPNGEELVPKFPKGQYVICHLEEKLHLYDHFRTNFNELGDNGNIVLFQVVD